MKIDLEKNKSTCLGGDISFWRFWMLFLFQVHPQISNESIEGSALLSLLQIWCLSVLHMPVSPKKSKQLERTSHIQKQKKT